MQTKTLALILSLVASAPSALAQSEVFFTDFESGLPPEFTAPGATLDGVQGYAGLGPTGGEFAGSFLRYDDTTLFDTTLTVTDLPPHSSLRLEFLLALIDSWDGTELMQVSVDGEVRFSEWFELAQTNTSSYVAPPGGLLSSGTNLGFSSGVFYDNDRAYDMGVESAFSDIPHTASSVTIVWSLSAVSGSAAQNWQGANDESWAIDNVRVSVSGPPPGSATSYCTAGSSASGCQALLSATGTASATAPTGFFLNAAGIEGAKDGIFFFGTNGRQANPWGNGTSYQCVVPPVRRAGLLDGGGTSGLCDGAVSQDLNAHWTSKPSHNPGPSALVQAQYWYRDPFNTSNQTTSLSDAIEFVVGP